MGAILTPNIFFKYSKAGCFLSADDNKKKNTIKFIKLLEEKIINGCGWKEIMVNQPSVTINSFKWQNKDIMNKGEMATIVLITANNLKVFSNIFVFTFSILTVIVGSYFWYHFNFAYSYVSLLHV